jgi:Zn-finger nucleic acid-binding protein
MTAVNRQGVEFDMCPTCRGVWLDRGELEKLVAGSSAPPENSEPRPPQGATYQAPYGRQEPQRLYKDDDDDDYYKRGKKKRFDLFDIFD